MSDVLHVLSTPLGPMTLAADAGGALMYLVFGEREPWPGLRALLAREPDGLTRDPDRIAPARRQLDEYFEGRRRDFDLPLALRGTPFQLRVWAELQRIPYGRTLSYGELARRLGDPKACRAVGAANGANPVSVIVPCHRVIGAHGSLVGYGGGLPIKERLLELEREPVRSLFEGVL